MKYEEIHSLDKEKAEVILNIDSNDEENICRALVAISMHEEDWEWVQEKLLTFLEHKNSWIRGVAALGFSHLARVNGYLDKEKVIPALESHLNDPEMGGRAEQALEDIEHDLSLNRILDIN